MQLLLAVRQALACYTVVDRLDFKHSATTVLNSIHKLLCSRYEKTTPNLCWAFCALLGTCTINKGDFFEIAFVVVDTRLPRFKALAYVLPYFDELTHMLIRTSLSICWGLLFCLRKAFIFYKFAESSLSVHISRVCRRFTIDLCLLNLSKRSSFKSLSSRCATK